jgi:hypothetical protein
VRGLAIVGMAYIAFTTIVPVRSQPAWLTGAKSLPLIRGSAQVLLAVVPDQHLGTAKAEPASGPKDAAIPVPEPRPGVATASRKRGQKAYGARERRELDRLIETTGGSGNP